MHPPPFRLNHRLSDWPRCCLEVRCCKGSVVYPVALLIERHGDMTFERLLCDKCRRKLPAPVYLVAGQRREHSGGAPADWAIELVPPPRELRRGGKVTSP